MCYCCLFWKTGVEYAEVIYYLVSRFVLNSFNMYRLSSKETMLWSGQYA